MTLEVIGLVWLLVLVLVCVVFVIPSIIAFRQHHPNRWAILAVNVCLGGTGIGWAAALIWALHAFHRSSEVAGSHGGESGLNVFANDVKRLSLVATSGGFTTTEAVAEIERLGRLRTEGFLNDFEYASLKAAVLGRV